MQLVAICLASFIILQNTQATVPGSPHRKFEYKLSFKGPHLVQKDGTVPFWEHSGSKYLTLDIIETYGGFN